ncbi:RCC1 and BTB domain-containing protein 1 [Folsomia candida]|uniref:RCC1 and BTB domain-containing protein 1 n=1 Tax=Folsomia candida TaxID=158441 RepID=A0A226CZT6_FOLCA|nr:RCC1 and BTB domain-containing protein 1 [Folsomia candida]
MESSASSPGVIAREKLKIFQIFRDVGPEGEDILKTAKLVHVADKREAFVVTMEDETYSFVRTRLVPSVCKIAKIPQLCGLRVKEFAVGMIELAITEDGFLYSWIISDPDVFYFEPTTSDFALLGRLKPADKVAESNLVVTPHRVLGSLAGKKVHQVALSYKRIMALTWGGEVHQWGGRTPLWTPTLVPKQHFHYQQVISITCSDDVSVALTSNGELFQWELDNEVPQKIDVDPTPFKKVNRSARDKL